MKRVRALTAVERALWAEVAKTVIPSSRVPLSTIDDGPAGAPPRAHPPEPRQKETVLAEVRPQQDARPAPAVPPAVASLPSRPGVPPLAGIERKLRQRVSRGQRSIDLRIDLHGLRQHEAHAALDAFLARAHAGGAQLVLVVTGKGRTTGTVGSTGRPDDAAWQGNPERGILNRMVPLWLAGHEARRFVIGFEPAAPNHGGSGALYVRIRKARG